MERIRVVSTTISSVGYDADSRLLEVEFASGEIYQYKDVPPAVAAGLFSATSKGKYLNHYIKRAYTYVKL